MAKNLVIVESPAKAKTIEKFLGKDFLVKSCYGHIRDLPSDNISVDIENDFKPNYVVPSDKKKVVSELKKIAKTAETIWLATDEDREGEAISWHLFEVLDLVKEKTKRIVFHEITKHAITEAVKNPRSINDNLVSAQQARRVLDRLVGFEISPILWRKVRPALSAGRVQSVAVRLVVEREREINKFNITSFYKVSAVFDIDKNTTLKAELPQKFSKKEEAYDFLKSCINADFTIDNIEVKPSKKSPSPPFITSTLQQEASRKLGYSVSRTMTLAQKLYEAGFITYMRTDSVNLSQTALDETEMMIKKVFGEKYSKRRQFTSKSKGAQEAHEAIRPTYPDKENVPLDSNAQKLYELIWKRTIASQMSEALLEKTNVNIGISTNKHHFVASGEVIKFDGFLKVYIESADDEDENETSSGLLPPLKKGQSLKMTSLQAKERFNRPAARFTEASLVKKLEEMGIGRPSTYAPTITTIIKRGYVVKESRPGKARNYFILQLLDNKIVEEKAEENFGMEKGKLFPSDIGMLVNDFLMDHFKNIMDYNFTAKVEKEFDEIAVGNIKWHNMLKDFYKPFHDTVELTINTSERVKGGRELGVDPKSGKKILAKIGRYGPYVQLGEGENEEKPKFAKLKPDQLIETLTLEDALELFKLPRELGEHQDDTVLVGIGRFGPYLKNNNKFYSLPKEEDPYSILLDRAIEIIEELKITSAKKTIQELELNGKPLMILSGRFGPYISYEKQNYKIPKTKVPENLSLEECAEIIENKGTKGGKAAKKTTAKKAAPKKITAKKKSPKK